MGIYYILVSSFLHFTDFISVSMSWRTTIFLSNLFNDVFGIIISLVERYVEIMDWNNACLCVVGVIQSVVYNSDYGDVFSVPIECVSTICFCDSKVMRIYTLVDFCL